MQWKKKIKQTQNKLTDQRKTKKVYEQGNLMKHKSYLINSVTLQ